LVAVTHLPGPSDRPPAFSRLWSGAMGTQRLPKRPRDFPAQGPLWPTRIAAASSAFVVSASSPPRRCPSALVSKIHTLRPSTYYPQSGEPGNREYRQIRLFRRVESGKLDARASLTPGFSAAGGPGRAPGLNRESHDQLVTLSLATPSCPMHHNASLIRWTQWSLGRGILLWRRCRWRLRPESPPEPQNNRRPLPSTAAVARTTSETFCPAGFSPANCYDCQKGHRRGMRPAPSTRRERP